MTLFRQEAVAHQCERLTGAISLAQPLSIKLTTALLVLIASTIIAFLYFADYARKETVHGFLIPNKGIIKSYAMQAGIIEQLLVQEGDFVEKGEPLIHFLVLQKNTDGHILSEQMILELTKQIALIEDEIVQHERIKTTQLRNLSVQQLALENEVTALKQQYEFMRQQLSVLKKQHADNEKLRQQAYISRRDYDTHQQNVLNAKQELKAIDRVLLQKNNQIAQLNFDMNNLPSRHMLQINQLRREQAQLNNQLSQIKTSYQFTITASHTGIVTAIQAVEGETISQAFAQSRPLIQILPEGAELVAELLLPTRSAGFIVKGQQSRLRFAAFPYQRFGFVESEITRIDQSLVIPNEMQIPVAINEPVYRLRAKLNKQSIEAYGKEFPLKSGMLLEADIMLEERSIIQWLLEPLYSLSGKLS